MCSEATKEPDQSGTMPIQIMKFAVLHDFDIVTKEKKFQEFCDELRLMAQKIMNEHANLPPAVFFVMENGDVYVLEAGQYMNSGGGKDFISFIINSLIQSKKDPSVFGVVMATEAWMACLPKDSDAAKEFAEGNKSVSELPGREEVIILNIQTADYAKLVKITITRLDDKTVVLGIPEDLPQDERISGRFAFFKKPDDEC